MEGGEVVKERGAAQHCCMQRQRDAWTKLIRVKELPHISDDTEMKGRVGGEEDA